MIQIWWLAAIIAQERAASGADKRNAILAPNLLENTSHVSSKPNILKKYFKTTSWKIFQSSFIFQLKIVCK